METIDADGKLFYCEIEGIWEHFVFFVLDSTYSEVEKTHFSYIYTVILLKICDFWELSLLFISNSYPPFYSYFNCIHIFVLSFFVILDI